MTKAELFTSIGEPFAAGLFELEGADPMLRYANALKRFWEQTELPAYDGGQLYPCGVSTFNYNQDVCIRPHYCNVFEIQREKLQQKSAEAYEIIHAEEMLVAKFHGHPHTVGGMGWTHSFPNYSRVLKEGLDTYRSRVEALPEDDFKQGLLITLDAIEIYHRRCLRMLRETQAPEALIAALEKVPYQPAETVYEAMVALNFVFYVDGCDDIGPLDRILLPYYKGEDILPLIKEFFKHADANDSWSGTLGPEYNEITRLCIQASQGSRRPDLQLLVKPDMPDWVWQESAAALVTGCGQPALYNGPLYRDMLHALMPEIPEEDLDHIAYGGCTELMLEGMSAVGSDDAGMNIALIFSDYMRAELANCDSYDVFFAGLSEAIRKETAYTLDLLNRYRQTRAKHRPNVVRTLLVDDCIDVRTEFNAGGARWVWSNINMCGVVNVIDSLNVIRTLIYEQKRYTAEEFIEKLDERDPEFLALAASCPSYGNDDPVADMVGVELIPVLIDALKQRTCYPRGKFIAVSNQFTTYADSGHHVPATPDGRAAGEPLCDSFSAIHGNDHKGPTAMLNSISRLPLYRLIGTPITNIRLAKDRLPLTLKPLVKGFFAQGGMQIQVSCISKEDMLDAMVHPERHQSLIVRVGGLSEYFIRLSPVLQETILNRTEH